MKNLFIALFFILTVSSANSQWQRLNSYPTTIVRDFIVHNGVLYGATGSSGMYVSYDSGATFIQRSSGLNNGQAVQIYKLRFMGGGLFAATVDGIYFTTNDGISWVKRSTGITIGPGAIYEFAYSLFDDNGSMYAGTFNSIYKFSTATETWTALTPQTLHLDIVSFIKYNNIFFTGTSAGNRPPIMYTTNDGTNWATQNIWNGFPVGAFCMLNDDSNLYAGTAHGFFSSSNNGANWMRRSDNMGSDPYVTSMERTGNTFIAGMNGQVLKSTNRGINWISVTDNLNVTGDILAIVLFNGKIYVTSNNGVFFRNLQDIVTEAPPNIISIPEGFKLFQNYPNPFNPTTNIQYDISKSGMVKLFVYDVNGKEINTLVNKFSDAGSYNINFDASGLGTGIYYYKLEANGSSQTRKMILLK